MLVYDEKSKLLKSVPIKLDAKGADKFLEKIQEQKEKAQEEYKKFFGAK
ncbi:MAG: hypothetical protein LBN08_02565 [Lactobacillales bacterium]|jgi:hypothetical protein|nr:hypothetical protein [Lactobacillales bacterium]